MNDNIKFTTNFSETNSEYLASYEAMEEMATELSSEDKEFEPDYEAVIPVGGGEVTDEQIEKAINDYFEKNPVQGVSKYPDLNEKPKINDVELIGNKTAEELGLQPKGNYLTEVPKEYALKKDIPTIPTKISAFENDKQYATESFVEKKITEAELGGGEGGSVDLSAYYTKDETDKAIEDAIKEVDIPEVDLSSYVTKDEAQNSYALKTEIPEIPKKVSAFENDAGYLKQHQDLSGYAQKTDIPNVPDWAMQPTKPSYTVDEVGADTKGSAAQSLVDSKGYTEQKVSEHNTQLDAHNDIRLFLKELNEKINHFLDIDDTTKDQASEIVKLIEDNRGLIEQITTDKVNVTDIIDNLTTNVGNKPLSAAQGVMLKALIDKIVIPTMLSAFTNDVGYLTEHQSLVDYAKKSELPIVPTNVSAFTNDSGYLTKTALLDVVYPVGSIYMSVNNVSPKTFFGGTWEAIKDRFLLSAGDTYSGGSTGGEATHTLTVDEIPSHEHYAKGWAAVRDGSGTYITLGGDGKSRTYSTDPVGGGKAHNNMPPYLAVYMWKRTA